MEKYKYFPTFEYEYEESLERLLKTIDLNNHTFVDDRTGTGTLVVSHQYFHLDDVNFKFPLLRGKKVYPYMAYKELIWMLRGRTDVQWLRDHKVTYWDEWEQPDGTIGKSYGYQFRNSHGVDQVQTLLDEMTSNPLSRRLIIDLWNVGELKEMALPPCQFLYQFTCVPIENNYTSEKCYEVDLHAIQRSGDSFLGVPYNFLFGSLLLTVVCDYCSKYNYKKHGKESLLFIPRDVHHTINHYHLYSNHIEQARQYINNVKENKNKCIDVPTKIDIMTPGSFDLTYNNIDEYLDFIEFELGIKESLKIEWPGEESYGVIKADISI